MNSDPAAARERGIALAATPESVRDELATPGKPLGGDTRALMETRFRHDFSRVRVHSGRAAAESAEALRSHAFTFGRDIVFGTSRYRPETAEGDRLLTHELTHVVQQDYTNTLLVQRFDPKDAAIEMVGRTFTLSADVVVSGTTLPLGTSVVIKTWSNDKVDVTGEVTVARKKTTVTIEKKYLVPPRGSGLVQYTAGVKSERKAYAALEVKIAAQKKVIADWSLKESSYSARPEVWQQEMDTHQDELKALEYKLTGAHYTPATLPARLTTTVKGKTKPQTPRIVLLNKALIEETMFNAFDTIVVKWVDHYHTAIGAAQGWPKLDANLVKSMLYQESHMGTQGRFLLTSALPVWHPMTRFNVGQAIDSSGAQQILMIEEMDPAIATKYKLGDVTKDFYVAQKRRGELEKKGSSRSTAEQTELDLLNSRSNNGDRWNDYFVTDPRWTGAVTEFFSKVSPTRNLDYDFWIRTAVRWLYEKRKGVTSWEAAIVAYNGSGARASRYKKNVVGRRDAAKAATGDFVPKQTY